MIASITLSVSARAADSAAKVESPNVDRKYLPLTPSLVSEERARLEKY
jgi:hypothetical protein